MEHNVDDTKEWRGHFWKRSTLNLRKFSFLTLYFSHEKKPLNSLRRSNFIQRSKSISRFLGKNAAILDIAFWNSKRCIFRMIQIQAGEIDIELNIFTFESVWETEVCGFLSDIKYLLMWKWITEYFPSLETKAKASRWRNTVKIYQHMALCVYQLISTVLWLLYDFLSWRII